MKTPVVDETLPARLNTSVLWADSASMRVGKKTPTTGRVDDQASVDPMTGAWNRAGFVMAATPLLVSCQRRHTPVALASFDMDTTGTGRSDADHVVLTGALVTMANQLRKAYRASDIVGRIGTYRLVVLLTDYADESVGIVEGVCALSDTTGPYALTLATALTHAGPDATVEDLLHAATSRTTTMRSR